MKVSKRVMVIKEDREKVRDSSRELKAKMNNVKGCEWRKKKGNNNSMKRGSKGREGSDTGLKVNKEME